MYSLFLKREGSGAQCHMLSERVRRLAERALQKGLEYSRRATHKWLSQALKGGAGPAHIWCGKEDALPDLPLVIRDNQGHFTADPQSVAEHYANEWKREWRDEDTIGFDTETSSIRDLRDKHVAEAHEWARNVDLSAASVRKACLSFLCKTAIGLDQHAFKDIALLLDNALGSLGEIVRQCFVKLAIPTQSLLQLLVLLGKKNGGSRTIAILHTTYRLTMRLVSAHISQWDVNFAGKWDSALKGNSALRAHVARAMGIEHALSEGHYVIHFLWDVRKFYDSIKAHLLIPQLVARGYPLEILVLGTLTHKSPRCLQVGNSYSNIITGCASSILAGCLQSWVRGLLFEFAQALGYVVPGSVCEERIDDLSHFVTNKSRMQLFHDAARIGKAVKVGTAELALTLSCKSTLLANDKSLVKLIVKHLETDGVPICLGTAATDLGIETAAVKRRCAAGQWKRIWKGRRRAKRVNRLCKMSSEAQKLTMTGSHPVQIYGHTAQGASNAQVDAMCRNLKLGTVFGKTQACSITTVAWFFGVKRVPQTAARVEQISEWFFDVEKL